MVREAALGLLAALAAACVSPDGPFTASGTPSMALHEARAHCKQSQRTPAGEDVDWKAYDRCMAALGWIKQTSPGSSGPPPSGGGGPAY